MAPDTTRPTYETIRSLQRELAEARARYDDLREIVESYQMPVAVENELAEHNAKFAAPGPSDAKGEQLDDDELTRLANLLEVSACGHRLAVLGRCAAEIERLKSRPSLTPLTDESVRGVLVDDGEPTKELHFGELYIHPDHGLVRASAPLAMHACQPVNLRPASEFGVPTREPGAKSAMSRRELEQRHEESVRVHHDLQKLAESMGVKEWDVAGTGLLVLLIKRQVAMLKSIPAEPAQKLVKLPEGYKIIRGVTPWDNNKPLYSEIIGGGKLTGKYWVEAHPGPALYGVPAERVTELEASVHELEGMVEQGESRANENAREVERLRKAMSEARGHIPYGKYGRAFDVLTAAITPLTAASGEFGVCMICGADLTRSDQCLACDKCEPTKQAEPKRAVTPPRTSCQADAAESAGDAPPISTSAPAAEVSASGADNQTGEKSCGDKVRGNEATEPAMASGNTAGTATDSSSVSTGGTDHQQRESLPGKVQTSTDGNCNSQPPSAPAAESEGNAQHHSEGAKIPRVSSGSLTAES